MLRSAMMIQPKFGEIVGDEDAQTPFELFRDKNMRDELSELLEVLDDRERKIIFKRFGLDGGKPKTLEEVGKKFGVTRERIRQLRISPWRNCVGRSPRGRGRSYGATQFNSSNPSLQIPPGRVFAWPKLLYRPKLPWT